MRTPTLQYLYLQKPVTMMVIICIISVLPWIGLGDFSTKGEPREAAVAVSMLESGNWILPQVYANDFAYKPPMAHWLMAAFSYPQGYVSEFTSRLPSALAFIVLIGFTLVFFGRRIVKFQEAFIATLLLITCVEIHRAAMTTRVDMLLTTFIVIGLFQLYRWEDKLELKGLPVIIPLLLGCAVLTKGPVGIILPLFVFGVYLLILNKYSWLTIFKSLLYIGVSSLFLPLLWYLSAWKQGGDDFFNVVMAENFGRFFHISTPAINYDLGHENGVWYNFGTLAGGFIPWTIFFFFSLFGLKIKKPSMSFKEILIDCWKRIRSMEKVRLFSLVALVCILFFYSIPSSKRSVYLMPAYPFIALFLAQYALYITEYRTKVTRVFAAFLTSVVSVVIIAILLSMTGLINPVAIAKQYSSSQSAIYNVELVANLLNFRDVLSSCIVLIVLLAIGTVYYQMSKKINIKILYATIALTFTVNLLIDGVIMRGIRCGNSSRPFAERISKEYPLDNTNMFVMNNLKEYTNMYGLNFYLGNRFHNFEINQPETGYLLATDRSLEKIQKNYGDKYIFNILTSTQQPIGELRQNMVLCSFTRNE
ncbi:ArnT family glycosyltransferase [Parabacteroides bouchesdurhonensis]|uniref:ArnT family glycosyltransferase n=1 Tax=Parabacteroides bouchesdurhonensis TaxID=1936995 RepID=UPI000E484538|nr:dolichyl-phosphate-mannose--protein mannosyltransferase [Parabacteroides bouchesdurhonensis]RHJ91785.1 dolichyl-phosphate-mannose--protein mannosyltransferase [Bacteroides sp. AM07-16]